LTPRYDDGRLAHKAITLLPDAGRGGASPEILQVWRVKRIKEHMSSTPRPSFGIMTAPAQVDYPDLQRVWREADALPHIEHAWLYDHLMPIFGDPLGPAYEGWTLLSALAAQTGRLRLGLLVTSNRFRPPAMLAKIAATVDVVAGGRLDFGIGAGSRASHPLARREYEAHGLPFHDFEHSVESLAEALTVVRRLWTAEEPFDFHGEYIDLAGAFCSPKPVQRPAPPIMIGGRSSRLLRVAAAHADLWNIPGGGDIEDLVARSVLLDRYCTEIGRDPASITRSIHLPVSYDEPDVTREKIREAIDAGFTHIILGLSSPYPEGVARWVVDELITRSGRSVIPV
jgi:alkanesulfonate monooxygenase SsuD/methylene tetrahydromethanopterin reductase-like flavin-dependent oxidoreductase (luciferase family)